MNFLSILALGPALDVLASLGGVAAVEAHVATLASHAAARLSALRHTNGGGTVVRLLGASGNVEEDEVARRSGVLNFLVVDQEGWVVSYRRVQKDSAAAGLSLRTGCHCNPGACYDLLGVPEARVRALAGVKEGCNDEVDSVAVPRAEAEAVLGSPRLFMARREGDGAGMVRVPLGSVRASLGWMSTWGDVEALVRFVDVHYRT